MYLSATTEKIQVVLSGAVTTNQLQCVASYQDVTATGMTLPMLSNQTNTNDTTDVDLVGVPGASTTRQVVNIIIYNADTVSATVTVKKDISGTEYIQVKQLLQAGDTLQWSRESGWQVLSGTASSPVTFSTFTADGTWTKPAGLRAALVFCGGAGGGGGSGRQGAAGENRFGGSGGSGGAAVWRYLSADDLAATVTVTVGTAGAGASGQAVASNNGSAGTAGGDTSFGGVVIAKGGLGGAAGTTSAAAAQTGGSGATGNPAYGGFAMSGASSSASTAGTTSTAGGAGFSATNACPGGAGGGGINSTNTSSTTAGAGGLIYENGISQTGPTAGASPNGVNNKSRFLHFSSSLTSGTGIGTGGAGGYPAFIAGGNGGYCAGGGGGSGTLNGTTSGAGGTGGVGICIVMNIF